MNGVHGYLRWSIFLLVDRSSGLAATLHGKPEPRGGSVFGEFFRWEPIPAPGAEGCHSGGYRRTTSTQSRRVPHRRPASLGARRLTLSAERSGAKTSGPSGRRRSLVPGRRSPWL